MVKRWLYVFSLTYLVVLTACSETDTEIDKPENVNEENPSEKSIEKDSTEKAGAVHEERKELIDFEELPDEYGTVSLKSSIEGVHELERAGVKYTVENIQQLEIESKNDEYWQGMTKGKVVDVSKFGALQFDLIVKSTNDFGIEFGLVDEVTTSTSLQLNFRADGLMDMVEPVDGEEMSIGDGVTYTFQYLFNESDSIEWIELGLTEIKDEDGKVIAEPEKIKIGVDGESK